jgi:hypothetical protein
MAILVMVSASGLLIDMHFCKGEYKTFAIFKKAKNCHDIANGNTKCLHHKKNKDKTGSKKGLKRKDCCQNKSFYSFFDIQNTQAQGSDGSWTNILSVPAIGTLNPNHFPKFDFQLEKIIKRGKPPPLGTKKVILYQSFLC